LLVYLGVLAVLVVAALLAFGLAALLHLHGISLVVFIVLILLLGIATAVTILILHFRAKKSLGAETDSSAGGANLDLELLLNDANRKLRTSQQGAKSLHLLPVLYVLGEQGAAKTTHILRSGLDPELLAGTVPREAEVVATPVVNVWFTKAAAIVEFGEALRQSSQLLTRLIERTRPRAYRSAFGEGAAARAAVVCLSAEQIVAGDGGASLMAAARTTGTQLRAISRLLGMPLPVYVIVTKLDRVSHFAEYVRNFSNEELRRVLGTTLKKLDASAGVYADYAANELGAALDAISYTLSEFRVEMLSRETEPANSPGVYEFPREFGKLRKNLNLYLVELCKPSQLSANPYLRGFYFTGIRAQIVERMSAPLVQEQHAPQEAGATRYIKVSLDNADTASQAAPQAVRVSTRVPQWTFLARLFPEVILGDKTALSATRQTAPARLFRRFLYGTLAFLLLCYSALLVVSYWRNSALEINIRNAARTLAERDGTSISLPGLADLQALDRLRQTIVELDGYSRDGAPWSYRFGLYQGDKLDELARKVYFDRFRPRLLNPAQAAFLTYLIALPGTPQPSDDSSSYKAAYDPLKAYLVTAGNHDKSVPQFLTPVFLTYWKGSRQVDPDQEQLAQKQIDFYATELARKDPYAVSPDSVVVEHARSYLTHFPLKTRIYQDMLNAADKSSTKVDFNRMYPGSAATVVDSYVVRGAFTRAGFAIMQDELQHIQKYSNGEPWVLGDQAGQPFDGTNMGTDLSTEYSSDFILQWHNFLAKAQVVGCGGLHEAPDRLTVFAGSGTIGSPLLELFYTVSHNTAVDNAQIKAAFASSQKLVEPNAVDQFAGPANKDYLDALLKIAEAIRLASQSPAGPTDPMAGSLITNATAPATTAVSMLARGFPADPQAQTDKKRVLELLNEPIECAARLAPAPGAGANAAGQKLCGAVNSLLGKFPFSPNSTTQASLDEVNNVFAPDTGAIWTIYNSALKTYLVPAGAQYVAAPAPPQPVNPRFPTSFTRLAHLSGDLYPAGAKAPTLNFALRLIPGAGTTGANFIVDGQRIPPGSTSELYKWSGADAHQASLATDSGEIPYQGVWALFHLAHQAQISHAEGKLVLNYPLETTLAGQKINQGKMVSFEVNGPGAELLDPSFLSGLSCVSNVVKAQ